MTLDTTTLGDLLAQRASRFGAKPFLLFEDRAWSYAELDAQVDRAAAGLRRLGVGRGTHVQVHLSNRPEFVVLFFALARLGAVGIPTNLALGANELAYIVGHADATLTVTEPAFLEVIKTAKRSCPLLETLVVVGGEPPGELPFGRTLEWSEVVADGVAPGAESRTEVGPDDLVLIMYTSGTTALPKGVMITHQNVLSAGHAWMWLVGFTPRDRTMTAFPLFHANALFFSCVGSMVWGGSFVLLPKFSASQYFAVARRYAATHFNFAGPAMALMLQTPPSADDREHPVRIVHDAMGTPELIAEWSRRFEVSVVMIYNLTESALATGSPVSGPRPVKLGSIGWPAPSLPTSTQIRIVDEAGNDVPRGSVGEILVKGPAVSPGYYKDPTRTAETFRGGWLHTGDAAYQDEDDCYWYADRIKDMIKPKGENVSSAEVEAAISSHPKVADVGVYGVVDRVAGEEIKASILLVQGETETSVPPRELLAWCEARLAPYKLPRFLEYRTAPVPRGVGGAKILKRELRKEKANPTEGCFDRRADRWLP